MKDKIIGILARITGQDAGAFTDDTAIRDINGFDSLQFVMMISELQEAFGIEIPLDKAINVETVGQLIACANDGRQSNG